MTKKNKAKILVAINVVVHHWKHPIKETLQPLLNAYFAGIETGDLEFAAYSLHHYSMSSYCIAKELVELERDIVAKSEGIAKIKQAVIFNWISIYHQTVLNLRGNAKIPVF
ncbi:MAG: hypothetical protein HC908_10495 [Calothrix sp. SM1_7_51]|nr:hypothetical protein [Calothrix sp. SM1_7_51]